MSTARDRRAPLFATPDITSQSAGTLDIESLERENDRGISALGDRVGMLRNVTTGIQSEVYSQHSILDNMSFSMSGIQMGLGASRDKFNKVMNDPQGRQVIYMAGLAAVVLFVLYLYVTRGR